MKADDILAAVGNTPLVGIQRLSPKPGVRLWAKLEGQNPTGSLKDRIALRMIEEAERDGRLEPGATILEPTSGNTGIALAMVASRKGYRLVVVSPRGEGASAPGDVDAEAVFTGKQGTNGSISRAAWNRPPHHAVPVRESGSPPPTTGTGAEIVRDLPEVTHFWPAWGRGTPPARAAAWGTTPTCR